MGIWANSIKRSNTSEKKLEDMFFPYDYDTDDCSDIFYVGVNFFGDIVKSINNKTKAKKIDWFFQDHRGEVLAFGKKMYEVLLDSPNYTTEIPKWFKGVYYDGPVTPYIGTMLECKDIKSSTPENSVIIICDERIVGNSYKILK